MFPWRVEKQEKQENPWYNKVIQGIIKCRSVVTCQDMEHLNGNCVAGCLCWTILVFLGFLVFVFFVISGVEDGGFTVHGVTKFSMR